MFILVFSLSMVSAMASNYEALTDESLANLYNTPEKKAALVKTEKEMRVRLESTTSTPCANKELAQEWVRLAETQVDLYNLKQLNNLGSAQAALQNALQCDATNLTARRLARELGR